MIYPKDVEFHEVPDAHRTTWAETNYFPFFVPEVNLSGALYNVFRPGLGVCMSDVTIFDRCATHWEGLAYTDNQQHVPGPPDLGGYSLRNGAQVSTTDRPRNYRVDYLGIDDTELHFDFVGLMRPQDFNDPAQDPLAKAPGGAWDNAFNGHFDLTGKVTGELRLRGITHGIDCLATMDHSWGPRLERDNGSATFIQAHFGEDLSINALIAVHAASPDTLGELLHGYVLRDGGVRALIKCRGEVERDPRGHNLRFPRRFHLVAEDVTGNEYVLDGKFSTWAPWAPYASVIYYQGMAQWQYEGRTGYGAFQEVLSRAAISRHRLST
jgi:hypothetical protein